MKTFTSWIFALLFIAGTATAQKVIVNSPASLAGGYVFTAASFGGTIDSVWTADAVFVDDGSANPTRGCSTLVNTAELMGKIALVDRGTCEFGIKALNAQNAGAIAVIIVNNLPGGITSVAGGGVNGGSVTIPVVMLSYEAGQAFRAALAEGATINISIGNIDLDNDLSLTSDNVNVLGAKYGAYPITQLREAGDFVFTPGVRVENTGLNEAANITATAVIEHTPPGGEKMTVYTETVDVTASLLPDSLSSLVTFPDYDPINEGLGTYTVTYTVESDSMEIYGIDNVTTAVFNITEDVYSHATINPATGLPRTTIGRTIGGGGPLELISFFEFPYGDGYQIDSVNFYVSKATALGGEVVDAFVYKWEDVNQDSSIQNTEITILAFANYAFDAAVTATSITLTLPLTSLETLEEASIPLEDGGVYGLGLRYTGSNTVFFGFDDSVEFWTQATSREVVSSFDSDLDFPYIVLNVFNDLLPDIEGDGSYFGGAGGNVSSAFLISQFTGTQDIAGPDAFEIKLFPNPTSDALQVDVELKESSNFIVYRVLNMQGQLINQVRKTAPASTDRYTVDAAQLAVGQYILMVITEQGVQARHFTVSR